MEWISIKDKLPEFRVEVLCFSDRENYTIYNVDTLKEITTDESGVIVEFWNTSDVSYWMPLPERPKNK